MSVDPIERYERAYGFYHVAIDGESPHVDTVGREQIQLDPPKPPAVPDQSSKFWVAYLVLGLVAAVAGFLAPQYVRAGTVTKTNTVVKEVTTNLPPVLQAGVDIWAGRPCDILSNSTDPNAEMWIHCPASGGAAPAQGGL